MRRIKRLQETPHSIGEHNYYIRRKKECPLCKNGSKVVHESEIN